MMKRLIFDLESDNLYFDVTKIHVIVTYDIEEEVYKTFTDPLKAIEYMEDADELIGHNIIFYDLPVMEKLHGFKFKGKVTDTLVISRLIWTNLAELDSRRKSQPSKLVGSHSLAAWGYRLGELKGEYGKQENAWDILTPEMIEYCQQDVKVTKKLYERELKENYSEEAIKLEHDFATIINKQVIHGFNFNEDKAKELYTELLGKKLEIQAEMEKLFPPIYYNKGIFTPKKDNKKRCYKAGAPMSKIELTPFNPASRQHIADRLKLKYNWKPKELTDGGQAKVDESVLSKLTKYPEAKVLAEYFMIQKRLGQLGDGNNAWLKLARNGRIHGGVNTNGAVTGRCTYSNPNVAQTPSVNVPYGKEFRSLFMPDNGQSLVGCDASGLELRCLAHYMNDPNYTKEILEGDIHTANQNAAGLSERAQAKTFIYGFLFGAGDAKIGQIVGKGTKEGKALKKKFLDNTPALKILREEVKKASKRGYLKGLDGRKLHVRSEHSALNVLLQSAGALVMKKAVVILYNALDYRQWEFGKDYALVANIIDEWQATVASENIESFKRLSELAIKKAGESFKFKCPLDGEAKSGANWAETH